MSVYLNPEIEARPDPLTSINVEWKSKIFLGLPFSNLSILFSSFLGLDERDRARVYDEVVDFFNDVYFNGPVEKQNRLVSSQNEREPVYFYSNDFRSRDIFGNTLLNRYLTK